MYQLMAMPLTAAVLAEYGGGDGLRAELAALGCQGVEGIWAGEALPPSFPSALAVGYHLTFYPDWLDFFREDRKALLKKYGSLENVRAFYGGWGGDALLNLYREDLDRARALGVRYVVFHVSDVSVEEGYTYRWLHRHEEVIDTAAEIVNALLKEEDGFAFLVENQWWPGFTMTDPALTERLLDGIRYSRKGILLDTGHLMNTNPALRTQEEGVAYIHRMLDAHGALCRYIRGMHFHQSLSGDYVRSHTGALPPDLPEDTLERFGVNYRHILQIDRHLPWTTAMAASLVERVRPDYLTHELSADSPASKREAILLQKQVLRNL